MGQLELFKLPDQQEKTAAINEKLQPLELTTDPEIWQRFQRDIFYALLHKNPDRYFVIDQVIEQAKTKGLRYILCKVSLEAKKFRDYARQVSFERMRAISFIRLRPIDQHRVLYGEFEIKHQTAEIIMLHFMDRFPQYNIMLVFGEDVYIGRDHEIFKEKIDHKKIELPEQKDEFERYWLAFYKTQYIPERKNLRYLKRMIPKKYWKWVTELKEFGLS
jgi:probable DNA metabolism protein